MKFLCIRILSAVALMAGSQRSANAASFQIQGVTPVAAVRGTSPPALTATFAVLLPGTSQDWTAVLEGSPSWASLSKASGTGPDSLTINFNTVSLAAGTYSSALALNSGGTVSRQAFTLTVITPNVVKMEADLNRPVIYALHRGTQATNPPGYVIFLNTTTDKVELVRAAGVNPTDFDLSYPEDKLYISNHGAATSSIRVLDLTTRAEVRVMNGGNDVYKINAGKSGRIVVEELDQWINASLLNSTTGAPINTGFLREGDGEFDPSGRFYYHCDNNISDAHIERFDLQGDSFVSGPASIEHAYGSRSLLMSGDGSRIFWQSYAYDRDLNELRSYGATIHASTFRGEVVFSDNRAFGGNTGAPLATLPVTTTMMAVSGDQTKLFLFNATTGAFSRVLMSAIGPVPPPVSIPVPADQAVVLTPLSRLQWSSAAGALSYRVYMGTDSAAVAAAGTGSPLYLGETSDLQRTLTAALVPGTTYSWRVDPVGFAGASTGPVWRFTASALVVAPNALTLKMARGVPPRAIPLTTAATPDGPWTASESLSWLSLSAAAGTSGDGLTATVNVAGLTAGNYSGAINFTFGGLTATLPVSLEVFTLALTKLTADPSRPWIYGLHSGTATLPESYVIFINTATRQIENAVQTGIGATDLTINHQEGRLYVSNWQGTAIQVVNLDNQTVLTPIPAGRDVYKLNAGRAGRIYAEEQDQWINASILNAGTGAQIGQQINFREGDAEVDPSGRFYYHCDNNSSGAALYKYDVSADAWSLLRTSPVRGYGSRNLVMSPDGSRLFWQGRVYDSELNELRDLGTEIYAATLRGELAVANNKVLNSSNGAQVATLPVAATVSAVAGDQSAVFYFNATAGTVGFVPMSSIAPVPVPGANVQPADNGTVLTPLARLSWDVVSAALKYRVFYGNSAAAVAAATTASPQYAGETLENFWALPAGTPASGTTLYWRVDYVGLSATVAGTVRSFSTLPVTPGLATLEVRSIRGAPPSLVRLPVTGLAGTAWTASTSGSAWLRVVTPAGNTGDTLELELTPGTLAAGNYTGSLTLSAGGLSTPIAVKFGVEAANYVALLADPARPRLYALQRPAITLTGSLVIINTITNTIDRVIPVSDYPTDFDLTPDNSFLYVVTRTGRKMHRVNLTDWSTQEKALGTSTDHSDSAVRYRVAAGVGSKVYWVDGEWGPRLHTMDFATGAETGPAIQANSGGTGIGDIARTGDGSELACWTQYGWSAGASGSEAMNIDISGASAVAGSGGATLTRDPLDTPVLPRADGSAVFMKRFKLTPDLGSVITEYPAEIYAVTKTTGIVFGANEAWRERTLTRVWQAPANVQARICAVAGDQSAFFYFNSTAGSLVKVLMGTLGDVPGPAPENGEVVSAMPANLSWTPNAQALRYEVYFGTEQAGVSGAAGTGSPFYVGTATQATLPFSVPFQTGGIWWWRVDTVLAGSTVKGTVWRFSGAIDHITRLAGVGTNSYEAPSLAMEGTMVMAGYPTYAETGSNNQGVVHVHRKQPGSEEWALHQIIQKPAAAASSAEFGSAIALKGNLVWIGARNDGTGGKAYEYRLESTGLWLPTGRTVQSPAPVSASRFGTTLAFDGFVLAAGIPNLTIGSSTYAGAVELFDAATLARLVRITEQTPASYAYFGTTLAMENGVLASGSPQRSFTSGNVEIWTRGTTTWTRTATLTQAVGGFGESLAFSGDRLLASAPSADNGTPGKVSVYQRSTGSAWQLAAQFPAAGPALPNTYSTRLATHGTFLALGMPPVSTFSSEPGRTWLYRNTGAATWTPVAPAVPAGSPDSFRRYGGNVAVTARYLAVTNINANTSVPGVSIFLHNPAGNLPPYFTSTPVLFAEAGQAYSYLITGADENEGDRFGFSPAMPLPSWLTLTDHGDGTATLAGTPPAGLTGDLPLTIDVLDESDDRVRQTFTLKVLAGGSMPRITASTGNLTSDDGQRVTLSVTVTPGGTLTYQWYYNGLPLSGQTGAALVLHNVQASDAGSYRVQVTRSGVWVNSDPMLLTVNQVPDRFGGDWPTFGGGTSHAGSYPATLAKHKFLTGWTAASAGSNQVATGGGRVYASFGGGFGTTSGLSAYSLQTGQKLWTTAIPAAFSINPPTFHRGKVYVQRGKNTNDSPDLRSFDASTGALQWTANFSAQWEGYYAPAVDDTGIYVNGGSYGGIYGFNLNGTGKFFLGMEQYDDWTPLLHNGSLYSWVAGNFRRHDINGGQVISTVTVPWSWSGWSMNNVAAAEGTIAVMHSTTELIAVNLTTRRVLWKNTRLYSGSPAIRDGIVYSLRDGAVESFNAITGVAGRVYETRNAANQPATGIHQPVVLDDTLIVSSSDLIWTFDLTTGALLQRLTGGGPLTYTDGVLLASGNDGTLRTWKVNQPAIITPPAPVLAATEDIPFSWDIAITDPDADMFPASVTGLPAWLTASPLQQGVVRLTGTPLHQHAGTFSFTVAANDGKSFPSSLLINGSVLAVNDQPRSTAPAAVSANEDTILPPLDLTGVFSDEEDAFAALTIGITGNTNEALFSSVSISGGALRMVLTPDAGGTVELKLTATDSGGLSVDAVVSITVNPVSDPPRLAPNPAAPLIPADGSAFSYAGALLFIDPDPAERLAFSIVSVDHPELFRVLAVDPATGLLTVEWTPYGWGTAAVVLRAAGLDGLTLDASLTLHLDAPPPPEWRLDGAATLNRQTGLIEQKIIVRNTGVRAIAGFELWLTTGQGTALYNGMTTTASGTRTPAAPWLLPYSLPLAAGHEVTIVLELHHPSRQASFNIAEGNSLNPLAEPWPVPPAEGAPFSISRVLPVTEGMLIEFSADPGASYSIEYSSNNQAWSACPIPIKSGGTRVQWLDRGPPFTSSAPNTVPQRFYRVRRMQPSAG